MWKSLWAIVLLFLIIFAVVCGLLTFKSAILLHPVISVGMLFGVYLALFVIDRLMETHMRVTSKAYPWFWLTSIVLLSSLNIVIGVVSPPYGLLGIFAIAINCVVGYILYRSFQRIAKQRIEIESARYYDDFYLREF